MMGTRGPRVCDGTSSGSGGAARKVQTPSAPEPCSKQLRLPKKKHRERHWELRGSPAGSCREKIPTRTEATGSRSPTAPLWLEKEEIQHLEISSRPQPRASGQGALEKLTLCWQLGFLWLQLLRTPRPRGTRGTGTVPPAAAHGVRAAARPWSRAKANPVGSCWRGRTQH